MIADTLGNLYIVDEGNRRIRKVDLSGNITTIAGNGTLLPLGEGGPASAAAVPEAAGAIRIDKWGNLIFSDYRRIRKIDPAGIITTIAGNGSAGYSGDGGPATAAEIWNANYLVPDTLGNLYFGDLSNKVVRKVDAAGIITTIAGTGVSGLSGDDGPATAAQCTSITGIGIDSLQNLYICDYMNTRIRKINPYGMIYNWVGSGMPHVLGYTGDGGPATAAGLIGSNGLWSDRAGNVYFTTASGHTIRKVTAPPPVTIAGGHNICMGSTTALISSIGGGVWSSSATAVATVATTGVVTSVAVGTAVITYMAAAGTAFFDVTVNPMPAAIIGADTVCVTDTVHLADATTGGIWSSGMPSVATVSATGVVTGMSVGSTLISYTLAGGCTATKTILVKPCGVAVNEISSMLPVNIYPNPSDGIFEVNIPGGATEVEITITDISGNVVSVVTHKNAASIHCDIAYMPQGNYFIKIKAGEMSYHGKVLLVH